jgi:hypothetical protein
MKKFAVYFLSAILLTTMAPITNACTVFMANDGQNIWMGNNEDGFSNTKYRMWYYPAKKGNYGYMIWTELLISKLVYGIMYKFPQGGINEYGLFMDYTAIDAIPLTTNPEKQNRKKEVVTDLLKSCKTVEEALAFIDKFNLTKFNSAQLLIGDATGNYATVTGAYVVRKTDASFALTNYCINDGRKEACYRRDVATHYLNTNQPATLTTITDVLQKAAQKAPNAIITNYSMAVDLKNTTIYLYFKGDYSSVCKISLKDELKKGKHHKNVVNYFPLNIAPVLEKEYNKNGVASTINLYKTYRQTAFEKYNFKSNAALNFAIQLIDTNNVVDAIEFLKCLNSFDTSNLPIRSWLGVAYKKQGDDLLSQQYFSGVLLQKHNDYLATLYGLQHNQTVIFKLPDFEKAEKVQLIGEFTNWKKNAINMVKENGYWTCKVQLPKGAVEYKFIVNNEYLADNSNYLHQTTKTNTLSKIYVW